MVMDGLLQGRKDRSCIGSIRPRRSEPWALEAGLKARTRVAAIARGTGAVTMHCERGGGHQGGTCLTSPFRTAVRYHIEAESEKANMADSTITVSGNLAADPELRFTNSGAAVVKFRIGVSRRYQKNGEWTSKTSWWNIEAWNQLAENVAATLSKGMRVIVVGEVDADEYTTEAGEKRTSTYVRANSIGPDLRWATATVERNPRSDENGGGKPKSGAKSPEGYGENSFSVEGDASEPF